MKLGFVGSRSKWFSEQEKERAILYIREMIDLYKPDIVVSGGADGVDTWAETEAKRQGIRTEIYLPSVRRWDGEGGFKARNLLIVRAANVLVKIGHSMSDTYGSGWTADQARKAGKSVIEFEIGPG